MRTFKRYTHGVDCICLPDCLEIAPKPGLFRSHDTTFDMDDDTLRVWYVCLRCGSEAARSEVRIFGPQGTRAFLKAEQERMRKAVASHLCTGQPEAEA